MRRAYVFISAVLGLVVAGAARSTARAEPTAQSSASPQPTLPPPGPGDLSMTSPVLGGGSKDAKTLVVRKKAGAIAPRYRRVARTHVRRRTASRYDEVEPLERPALAGVELVAPIPRPLQPPHFTVPMPAYPLDNFTTFFTTPPPPVMCHRVPPDPYAPDPRLYREKAVVCDADNP